MTRTRAAGQRWHAEDRERWHVVVSAQQAACAAVGPGRHLDQVDAAAREIIEQHWSRSVLHSPYRPRSRATLPRTSAISCHPAVSAPLEAGMVTSIEPGIYIVGLGRYALPG